MKARIILDSGQEAFTTSMTLLFDVDDITPPHIEKEQLLVIGRDGKREYISGTKKWMPIIIKGGVYIAEHSEVNYMDKHDFLKILYKKAPIDMIIITEGISYVVEECWVDAESTPMSDIIIHYKNATISFLNE